MTSETNSITLSNLKPARTHYIKVAAVNGAGRGKFSNVFKITTKEDIPGPPVDLKVLQVWPDKINFAWMNPKEPNGIITGEAQMKKIY